MELGFLGFGYSAGYIIRELQQQNMHFTAWGSKREIADTAQKTEHITMFPYRGDVVAPALLQRAKHTTHMLISIPPIGGNAALVKALQPLLEQMPALKWLGYCSTTGVYGDHQGNWVEEEMPANPQSRRSKNRMDEEQALLALDLPLHIFRLSGIYGPGRSAFERLAENKPVVEKQGQVFSRIHVEDIAQTILASMRAPRPGAIYNLADDMPTPSHEPVAYAAKLLGQAAPEIIPYAQAQMSPMAQAFFSECRRVRNDKIKRELGVVLRYPTYKEGLEAIFKAQYQ